MERYIKIRIIIAASLCLTIIALSLALITGTIMPFIVGYVLAIMWGKVKKL